MTIWACQAGKDVYVEKPISHNIVEGRKMIEVARRYNRVVEVGTQRRSGVVLGKAVQFLRDGGLGKINAGKTVIYRARDPIGVVANSAAASRGSLRHVARSGTGPSVQRESLPLPLALVLGIRHHRPGQHGRPFARRRALAAGKTGASARPRTALADCTKAGRQPTRRRRIRNTRPINMRTAPSSTAICGTGTPVHPKPRASTSSVRRAG